MTETGLRDAAPATGAAGAHDEVRPTRRGTTSDRLAAAVFFVFIGASACALLLSLGRYFWFHGDEWDFLVNRDAGNLGDLLRAHNEHPSVVPILVYRLLWNLFGLRSYVPYQVPVIALHLTAAVLLRAVMRRCGVHPWIATAAAAIFVLFGPGEENIIWAFQIGFTGSLVFGLAHLLLADHDGPFDRRDWIGLGMGTLGFLCSGLAPIFTAIVGAVVLVRRGWRAALFHTVPLAIAFGTWFLVEGPQQVKDPYGRATDVGEIAHFVQTGAAATFRDMAGNPWLGVVFALVLVVGLTLAWRPLPRGQRLRQAVVPLALLLGALLFLVVSGYGRWWIGRNVGDSSRYVHLTTAFTLPALAVAVDALTRRWRAAVPVAAVVLVAGIPHNIGQFDTLPPFNRPYFAARRELIASLARSSYVTEVPRSTRPDLPWSTVTAGWLVDARRDGKLPGVRDPSDTDDPSFRLRFGLSIIDAPPPARPCTVVRQPIDLSLRRGDELGVKVGPWTKAKDGWFFKQSYTLQLLDHGRPVGATLVPHPDNGHLLRAQLDDLDVRLGLAPGTESVIVCR